jgi:hypothetical protein
VNLHAPKTESEQTTLRDYVTASTIEHRAAENSRKPGQKCDMSSRLARTNNDLAKTEMQMEETIVDPEGTQAYLTEAGHKLGETQTKPSHTRQEAHIQNASLLQIPHTVVGWQKSVATWSELVGATVSNATKQSE